MRQEHFVTNSDSIAGRCFNYSRFLLYRSQSNDPHLWLHDNGCSHYVAEGADVGNSERAAHKFVGLEFVFARPPGEVIHFKDQSFEVVLIGIVDYRNDQVPSGSATAMPMLMAFRLIILSPSTDMLIIG